MTTQEHKIAATRFFEALGKGDAETLRELMNPDAVAICTGTSMLSGQRSVVDICAAAGMLGQMTQGGIAFEILALTAEEDRVSCEVRGQSTLANGRPYNNEYHFLFFFRDGRIQRLKEYMDTKLVDTELGPLVAAAGAAA